MTIYVVLFEVDHEGAEVHGAYSSREKADEAAATLPHYSNVRPVIYSAELDSEEGAPRLTPDA